MRIESLPCRLVNIKHQVLDPPDEMLVNVKFVLWKVLVKVLLENLKANCISIFMFSIVVSILLQAVIGEMHVVVLVLKRVIVRAGPQIALLVVIELVLV